LNTTSALTLQLAIHLQTVYCRLRNFALLNNQIYPNEVYMSLNSDTPLNFTTIDIDKISHVVQDLKLDGHTLTGQISVLNIPFGNILKQIFPYC
jgi:hypothetical protein